MCFSCVSLLNVCTHWRTLNKNGCRKYDIFAREVLPSIKPYRLFLVCENVLVMSFLGVVAPIVLIGNKTDLQMDLQTIIRLDKMNQELTRIEDGFTMAEEIGAYTYLECSAWMNVRVREVFETATRAFFERESKPSIVQ